MTPEARFAGVMAGLFPATGPARLGLAVSGGGDSIALMHLAAGWARRDTLHVATVDHGLRPQAAQEAREVARMARVLGLPHTTLHWGGWDGHGNLQDAARTARRDLLATWAQGKGLDAVLLGHTEDDQAETVLMRLARGSGVDGLAAMAPHSDAHGVTWLRPLLGHTRAELRDWLRGRGIGWIDDPSNDNPAFDRIKARQMLTHLDALGLTRARLAQTAQHMQDARAVLETATDAAARNLMRVEHGDIVLDAAGLDALPHETRHRLVARALCCVASTPFRPRLGALRAALSATTATLHGCLLTRNARVLRITREAQAVAHKRAPLGTVWDHRWTVYPPDGAATDDMEIGALGASGLAACPDRARWCLPRRSLLASPAVWQGTRLIAAPLAGLAPEWRAFAHDSAPRITPQGSFALNVSL